MSIVTTSIDRAASGFVRHRFMRAMTTSWMVLAVTGTLAVMVGSAMAGASNDLGVVGQAIVGLVAILIVGGTLLALLAVFAAIVDLIDRRLVALAGLLFFGGAMLILPIAALGGLLDLAGLVPPEPTDESGPIETASMVVMATLASFVAWEGVAWAWWQLRIDHDAFLAIRGWRPPGWRILSILRRVLGLPAFVSNFGQDRLTLTVLYFGVALFNVGVAAVFALPFLPFADVEGRTDLYVLVGVGIALATLLTLNLVGAGNWISRVADRRATVQYQRVWEWDARPPIVFLRMFEQDDEQLPALVRHPLLRLPTGVSDDRTLDEILLEHGSPYGPVIAIGDPRDQVRPLGAARIFVPAEGLGWQDVVKNLVASAQAVVMCPGESEGVQWELDLVAQQENLRVAYVANPELPPETTTRLFRRVVPGGEAIAVREGEWPIAAFRRAGSQWHVLTTSIRPSVQIYTIAINMALQALLGTSGTPLTRPPRKKRVRGIGRRRKAQTSSAARPPANVDRPRQSETGRQVEAKTR